MKNSNVSYGCIAYLYNELSENYNFEGKEVQIILATVLKLHKQGIVTLAEKKIIFPTKINKRQFNKLDENEKLIYNILKEFSENNILTVKKLMTNIITKHLYFRDKFVDVQETIKVDLE